MSRKIDIELTSAKTDGTWTWRVAGAKQPKGVLDGALLPAGSKVGDVLRAEAEFELEGTMITSVAHPPGKRPEIGRLELLDDSGPFEGVTTSLVPKGGRPRREWDDRGPRTDRPGGAGGAGGRPPGRRNDGAPGRPDRGLGGRGPRPDQAGAGARTGRDPARPDSGRPEGGRPDSGRPDTGRPDTGRGDAGRSGAGRPSGRRPDGRPGDAPSGTTGRDGGAGRRDGAGARRDGAGGRRDGGSGRNEGDTTGGSGARTPSGPPRPKRLIPGNTHRTAVLESLPPEERAVADQLLQGGIPAVRRALQEQNARAREDGRPEIKTDPLLTLAEELLPRLKGAEWRDRADAAAKDADEIGLRDLRSVVAGSDAVARDDESRILAKNLRETLDRREAAERDTWLAEITTCLDEGRVTRALRVAGRPPDPRSRFPAEMLSRLADAASAAMGPETPPDRWAALLAAALESPVRRSVKPAGLPAAPGEALLGAARQASGRIPALAALLGLQMPPPPRPPSGGARPPRPVGRPAARQPRPPPRAEPAAIPDGSKDMLPIDPATHDSAPAPAADNAAPVAPTPDAPAAPVEPAARQTPPSEAAAAPEGPVATLELDETATAPVEPATAPIEATDGPGIDTSVGRQPAVAALDPDDQDVALVNGALVGSALWETAPPSPEPPASPPTDAD